MNVIPLEDRVVIEQDDAKKQTESGIIIPDISQKKPAIGTILAVGPGLMNTRNTPIGYRLNDIFYKSLDGVEVKDGDRVVPVYLMAIKEGDRVMFQRMAGAPVDYDGKEYLVVRMGDIICRV